MRMQTLFTICVLVSYISLIYSGAVIDLVGLTENMVIHTADYEIISVLCPANGFDKRLHVLTANEEIPLRKPIVFFILADDSNGKTVYKGLYVRINGEVTKLLENGQDAIVANDKGAITVYFAASDGIYLYDFIANTVAKYGNISDNIVGIAKLKGKDEFYILTEDHVVWKVTNRGTKKEKVSEIVGAQQIVIDRHNNLYYKCNNTMCVYGNNGIKRSQKLLDPLKKVMLVRPAPHVGEGAQVIVDNLIFVISADARFSDRPVRLTAHPTAASYDAQPLVYIAYNKNIYEIEFIKWTADMRQKIRDEFYHENSMK